MYDPNELNLIEVLQGQFAVIGQRWKEIRVDTGLFLLELEENQDLSDGGKKLLKEWIKNSYNISFETQKLLIRVAQGELPADLMDFTTPSIMAKLPQHTIQQLIDDKPIPGWFDGKATTKRPSDMNKQEKKLNLSYQGFKPINQKTSPTVQINATDYRIEGKNLFLYVPSIQREVRFTISEALVNQMAEAIRMFAEI